MSKPILRRRIFSALRLQPMTYEELARCLCSTPASIAGCIRVMREHGNVQKAKPERRRNGRPANRWRLAA